VGVVYSKPGDTSTRSWGYILR